jgi:hypothetical protein
MEQSPQRSERLQYLMLLSAAGEMATMDDWEAHLTTIFPEVRLKRYMEMRGADGGPWSSICALPALWIGLLYDEQAQAACMDLISGWSREERTYLRAEVQHSRTVLPLSGHASFLQSIWLCLSHPSGCPLVSTVQNVGFFSWHTWRATLTSSRGHTSYCCGYG